MDNNTREVKIPKIIMQTWKNRDIPTKWQESPLSIKKYMPDWNYVLMTDEDNRNFVINYFPDFLYYYDNFPYNIQRADAIRYLWLAINGGIYLDLDIVIQGPLDKFFTTDNDAYFVCSGNIGSYITNSFMAGKKGVKIWYDMIDYMKMPSPWWALGKHMIVMNTTGPIGLNYIVKNSSSIFGILPKKIFMPCSICNINHCDTSTSIIKPLEGSSWIALDTQIYNFFLCRWKSLLLIIIIVIIVIILYFLFRVLNK